MKSLDQTLDSREVAEMVGKEHKNLMRDVRSYEEELGELKIEPSDFFRRNTYSSRGKSYPCYDVTKKGCEFIAHKLTGIKGTEFTARYINRFHEMTEGKLPCPLNPIIASSVADLGRVTERIMTKQGSAPHKIAEAFKLQCEQFGIQLPSDFVKIPEYEQMSLTRFMEDTQNAEKETANTG
jgi:Rha family phage regulatory protein